MSDAPPGQFSNDHVAREVLESLLEGCQVIGFDWRYLFLNDTAAAQGGRPRQELLGRTMMECYPGIEQTSMFERLRRCMAGRTYDRMVNEFKFPDGSTGFYELRFVPVPTGVCVLSMDISEQRRSAAALARTEEQLRQSQKLEAIGQLAAGIAHDFNNLLSVILSYSDIIREDLKPGEPLRDDVDEIHAAGMRAADLTRQLLVFSRQQSFDTMVLDLDPVLSGMQKMLKRLLGADIDLTLLLSNALWNVKVDPGQVEQVVLNLAVNARDAMPQGGKLTMESKNVVLDEDYALAHVDVHPGEYIMIAVTDTGVGMGRETQARMFEPFFTTKEKGKGTGLGLATVFGIVKQSGGHIWLYSEPGQGTTFKLYFPRAAADADEPREDRAPAGVVGGNETILVVEDDEQVRGVTVNILRRHGYRVLEASNGGEALLVCEQHAAKIHLLLTDVVLPRMSGRLVAERVGALRPDICVLYMSGYTDDAVLQHGILESDVAYLQKPITPDALGRKVRQTLDSPRR